MELLAGAAFAVGVLLGTMVRRWWLLGVIATLWVTVMVAALTGGTFDSDPDLAARDWVLVLTALFFLPAWIGAAAAVAIASHQRSRGRGASAARETDVPDRRSS